MNIRRADDKNYVITLPQQELVVLNNALNEVCNALLEEGEFETRMGIPMAFSKRLLREIQSALDGPSE